MTAGLVLVALPLSAVNRVVKPADYAAIEKRNPFGLVDPPKPQVIVASVDPVAKEPPPNVELTGMYHDSIKNKTYALFSVEVKGEPKKRAYMLSEGENQDGLRVEEIDRKTSNVKINLKGEPSTITFSKPKTAAMPNPRVPPGVNAAAARRPQYRQQPDQGPNDQPNIQQFSSSGRKGNFTGTSRSSTAVAGGMSPVQPEASTSSLRAIPTRQMRTEQPMTRQEQEIIIEAQRARNQLIQSKNPGGGPPMPPLPPTSLTTPEDYRRIVVPPQVPSGQ